MTPIALKALKLSIAHHKENLKAKTAYDVRLGIDECALCELFYFLRSNTRCLGCPVRERSGEAECRNTPYRELANAAEEWRSNPDWPKAKAKFLSAERAEINFLESLLPKGKKK